MKDNATFVVTICAVMAVICTGIISDTVFRYKVAELGIKNGCDVSYTKN